MGTPQILQQTEGKPGCQDKFADGLSTRAQLPVLVREFVHNVHFPHLNMLSRALATPCVLSCSSPMSSLAPDVPVTAQCRVQFNHCQSARPILHHTSDLFVRTLSKGVSHTRSTVREPFFRISCPALLPMLKSFLQWNRADTAASPRRKGAWSTVPQASARAFI